MQTTRESSSKNQKQQQNSEHNKAPSPTTPFEMRDELHLHTRSRVDVVCRSIPRAGDEQFLMVQRVFESFVSAFDTSNSAAVQPTLNLALIRYSQKQREVLEKKLHRISTKNVKIAVESLPKGSNNAAAQTSRQKMIDDVRDVLLWWKPRCNDFFIVVEDDFEWCPNSAFHLMHILQHRQKQIEESGSHARVWRFSYGFNGVLLRCRDIDRYVEILSEPHPQKNVDWLLASDWAGERGDVPSITTYRYNLLEHRGFGKSTVGSQTSPSAPRCYDPLVSAWVLKNELYNYSQCAHKSDFSPCAKKSSGVLAEIVPLNRVRPRWVDDLAVFSGNEYHFFAKAGHLGQSCDDACRSSNSQCHEPSFPLISRCSEMEHNFDCRLCQENGGVEQPSYLPNTKECLVNVLIDHFSCAAAHPRTQRLCPCIARQNEKVSSENSNSSDVLHLIGRAETVSSSANNTNKNATANITLRHTAANLKTSDQQFENKKNLTSESQQYTIHYGAFAIRFPIFYDDDSRDWWLRTASLGPPLYERHLECKRNNEHRLCAKENYVAFWTSRYTSGRLDFLQNVAMKEFPCGWASEPHLNAMSDSNPSNFNNLRRVDENNGRHCVLVTAPQSEFIQHMIDGALPKLAHFFIAREKDKSANSFNVNSGVTFFVHRKRGQNFEMVYNLWELFVNSTNSAFPDDDVFNMSQYSYFFPKLLSACVTPPFHPILWQKMHQLVHDRLDQRHDDSLLHQEGRQVERKKLIYLRRSPKTGKNLRLVANNDQVEDLLRRHADDNSLDFAIFSHTQYPTLDDVYRLFSTAAIVVGPHGGAFANLLFCKPGATIVEIRPRVASPRQRTTSENFWIHSELWGHSYRLLWAPASSSALLMTVDLNQLRQLMDRESHATDEINFIIED